MREVIQLILLLSLSILMIGCNKENSEIVSKESFRQEEAGLEISEPSTLETEEAELEMFDFTTLETVDAAEESIHYISEEYGEILPYGGEFYYDENTKGFSYELEMFYLNSDFLYSMNDTLQEFYDGYIKQYQETENFYMEQGPESVEITEEQVPYSKLLFLGIQHIENDYVSLLFNDVTYMGGARPYSRYDAITIDCCTGREVTASEILMESNEVILEKISDLMGLDVVADWEDIDFYLQEDSIVFFYRMPGYWEDVILELREQ